MPSAGKPKVRKTCGKPRTIGIKSRGKAVLPPAEVPKVRKTRGKLRKSYGDQVPGQPVLPPAGRPKIRKTLGQQRKSYWDQVPQQSRNATGREAEGKVKLRKT